ncbi:MAG: AI-2E family transporter [Leptolyngbyaceae cyanobacterium bins.59]|nr:AI-2E family transporter [Leptolyngbyaceae cyanobacterium bins.59]
MLESINRLPPWLRLCILFPLAFLNGWLLLQTVNYLQPMVSLLLTATILSFLLNFPIQALQERGMARGWAIGIVLASAFLILGIIGLTLVPLIVEQLSNLVTNLPQLLESGNRQLTSLQQWSAQQRIPVNFGGAIDQAIAQLSGVLQAASSQLLNFILGTISSLINILFVVVLVLLMVLNGKQAWEGLFSWFSSRWRTYLQITLRKTFRDYFATQALLAGILSVAQSLVFLILGLPYSILFGVAIGITTLIPYASAVTIFVVSLLVALQDFGLGIRVLIAAVIVGQINDNLLAPRLVGKQTGLNPIWLIVALFVGGKIAGVLGLLVAVPLASVIKSVTDELREEGGDGQEMEEMA